MQVIRRLYLYAMSGVTLAVLAAGLRILIGVLFDLLRLGDEPLFGGGTTREQVSLAGALIGVGLPVWAIHWALIRRGMAPGASDAEEERGSAVRAAYLTVVLAVSLALLATAAVEVLRGILQSGFDLRGPYGPAPDLAGAAATALVAGAAWGFHARIRRNDTAAGPLDAGAGWIPRLYLYGAMLVSAIAGLQSVAAIVDTLVGFAIDPAPVADGSSDLRYWLTAQIATLPVLAIVFVAHAVYAGRLLADSGWRGASERPAHIRVAFFALLAGIGTYVVITDLATGLRSLLSSLLGATTLEYGDVPPASALTRTVIVSLLVAIPWLATVIAARRQLLSEGQRSEVPGRATSVARLDAYLASLIGLAFGAVSLGWLLGIAIDALLGGERTAIVGSGGWKLELATFLPNAVLGLALWTWSWSRVVARTTADPNGEAGSSIRRAALLIALAVSLIAGVISLGLILYRVFGSLLGIPFSDSAVAALSAPAGALVIAGAVAIYHGLLVRLDGVLRGSTAAGTIGAGAWTPIPAAPAASPAGPSESPATIRRILILTAPADADLAATVEAIRAGLPPGVQLDQG